MSNLAVTTRASTGRWSLVGVACALAAAAVWVLAGFVDDGLYMVTGILGIAGFAAGVKGRRDAKHLGERTWPALTAIVLGGLLGGSVLVAFVYFVSTSLAS